LFKKALLGFSAFFYLGLDLLVGLLIELVLISLAVRL
jgi:hypothetical protein